MSPALLCMGEPMLEFSALPPGADGRQLYLQGFGGDISNAAVAAARQGASVGVISALGADFAGEAFFSLWRSEGVDASAVRRDPHHPTGVYFITYDADGHRFFYLRKDSAASRFVASDLPEAVIAAAKCLFVSGISLGISPTAADAVLRAIAIARAHKLMVAIDTNYRAALWPPERAAALIHAAIAQADIALPSIDDARLLSGRAEPDAILDFYLGLGPSIVALKLGAAGALLASPAGRLRVPALAVRAVDATGAGDVFSGSFLARLLAGDAAEAAARYAAAAAGLSTTGLGAVAPIPRPEAVRAALAGLTARPAMPEKTAAPPAPRRE